MDHGLIMGNLNGLQDPAALLEQLLGAGVDGTLMSPGLAKQLGPRCKAGGMSLILTLDYQLWSCRAGEVARVSKVFGTCGVARAAKLGADAVKLLMPYGLGRAVSTQVLRLIAEVAEQAQIANMLLSGRREAG